ncbi:MAG: TetR/AcrR family transcriptional regulator [Thermomicrobiales bacterium]
MQRNRRTRDSEQTRAQILDAASQLFVEDGYDAVSVRKIAGRANVSHGTIYIHFKDKDDLLYQASEEQFSRLLSRLRRLPRSREPIQRLGDALLEAMKFGLDHPNEYQLMMGLQTTFGGPKSVNQWGPSADQVGAFFQGLLDDAYQSGAIVPRDRDLDELMLLGHIHGVVLEGADDAVGRERGELLANHVVDTVLAGLQARERLE